MVNYKDINLKYLKNKMIKSGIIILLFYFILIFYILFLFIYIKELIVQNNQLKKEISILQAIKKKSDFINSIDLKSDNSITKFVNNKLSFNDKRYIPKNLISFIDTGIIKPEGFLKIKKEALPGLLKMNKGFYKEFNKNIKIISSYRGYDYQKTIKDKGCSDNLCAKAGYSEHQTGLTIDIFEVSTNKAWKNNKILSSYFIWLNNNAYKYGFINTYIKGIKIDGYDIEPWHFRYLGIQLATHLKKKNISFAEFYKK